MKVFLSHSTKDKVFVEKLATAIAGAGFVPWLCEADVEKNANFVANIEEGLAACDVALLIWSRDAAQSGWTTEEWTAVLSRQVQEQRVRLGIVLLRDYPLPELLRTKNYIRVGADEQAALDETVDWLKHRETAQRLSGLQAPIYLPDYRPQDFVGRAPYLELLRNTLIGEPMTFLLYGEPGSGKSLLALKFAWEAQKDFDAVIFLTCGQRSLDTITADLAGLLPIDVKALPSDEQRKAAIKWLRARQTLLVLDDVWSPEIRQLEPGPSCSVLYTSRLQSLPGIAARQTAKVEKFSDSECDDLFHAVLDPAFSPDEVTEHRIVLLDFAKKVEMLPIAVAVGASLLRERAANRLDRGVLRLRLDALTDGLHDVNALFMKAIESQPAREQKLLAACAICMQEGFWLPLTAEIAELTQDEAGDAASRLVHSSLLRVLDRQRQRFQLHALLRDQVGFRVGETAVESLQERRAAALEGIFEDWKTHWENCRECLEEIVPASAFLWKRGERERHNRLSNSAFFLAQRIGELGSALRIMNAMEQLRAGMLDPITRNELQSVYGNQAGVLKDLGQIKQSMELLEKREAICLELGNKDGLQSSYCGQAVILQAQGRLKEALVLFQKQAAVCLEIGEQEGLALSYGNQGLILKEWGQMEEALILHKKEEAIWLVLGDQDGLQRSYGNQAIVLQWRGRLDEALALYKKQEGICLEFGIKEGLQRSYGNQAVILNWRGRLDEALALYKKQEGICLEMNNQDGLQVSLGNQAIILQGRGQFEAALELYRKKERICLELGRKNSLGYCYWNWGKLAREQGDKQTQKQKFEQALALFTDLEMPRERAAVQMELDKSASS